MKKKILFTGLAVLLITAAGGYWLSRQAPNGPVDPMAGIERPGYALADLEGRIRKAEEWDGRVVLVNFWAPWCPPCRNEIPAFIQLQETYGERGLTIVGITIDTHQNAQDFTDTIGVNYPILIGDEEGIAVAQAYGNRVGALPYTAVVDRGGIVRYTHRSELTYEQAKALIEPLL